MRIYDTTWKSAENDPDTVSRLIQEDIHAKFHGDITQAKKRWPKGVAVGLLSVARSDQRDPRLCLDSTIPNFNAKVQIEEKSFNPCVEDIFSAKVVAHSSEGVGLTIDVSKAHKRLRIREDEWVLSRFQHRGKLYHYTVCHFGARFSAEWWSRMGAVLIRICHKFFSSSTADGCASMIQNLVSWGDKYDGLASTSISIRAFGKYRKTTETKPLESSITYVDKETKLSAPTWNGSWAF